jgi:probable O-glycosylation ligase (exosortase A-associated)
VVRPREGGTVRDLMILGMMCLYIPLALSNAFLAYLLWCWTAVIALNGYVYGFMRSMPINLVFALIAIILLILGRDKLRGRIVLPRTSWLFILFAVQATISYVFAYDELARNTELYTNLLKALAFCILMPCLLTERYRIHALVMAITLGLTFHGVIEGLKSVVTLGGHKIAGLARFGDNNHFAIVMVMVIPLLLYVYRYSAHRLLRWIALAGVFLSVATVIGTHSRGGFLSMALMAVWIVFNIRRRIRGAALLGLAFLTVVVLAPSGWSERMNTIKEAGHDSSFMTRVVAWKISSEIALQSPFTGGGFHAVQSQEVWSKFRGSDGLLGFVDTPYRAEQAFAAHSVYFEVLGDLGFVGLLIFLAILANTFIAGFQIRQEVARRGPHLKWAADLANMLAASMIGYVVGAAALSLAYHEVMYMFVMLMQVLLLHVRRDVTANSSVSETQANSSGAHA